MRHRRRASYGLLLAALVACLSAVSLAGPVSAGNAVASIVVDDIVTPGVALPQTADTPPYWVARNTAFDVHVRWLDDAGVPTPFSTSQDTAIAVTAVTPTGTIDLGTVVAPADSTGMTFTRTIGVLIDDVRLHLAAGKGNKAVSGNSLLFDIQREDFKQRDAATQPNVSIGGADETTCNPVPEPGKDVCFNVFLPTGGATGSHLISLGSCNVVNPCPGGEEYWWSPVQLTGGVAITDMGLDKSLRSAYFPNGVPKLKWLVRASGSETWVEAPACPSRGTIGADQDFCQDVSWGHKDNSGDTWIRLLWDQDIRGSVK